MLLIFTLKTNFYPKSLFKKNPKFANMKKLKFILMFAAAALSISILSACGNKSKDDDDDDPKGKHKKEYALSDTADSTYMSEYYDIEQVEAHDVAMASDNSDEVPDFDTLLSYLEANASPFFSGLEKVIRPVDMLINGQEPSENDAAILDRFVDNNQDYFEAIGMLIGYMHSGVLSESEQARLDTFLKRYDRGLANVMKLLNLGMAAQGMDL